MRASSTIRLVIGLCAVTVAAAAVRGQASKSDTIVRTAAAPKFRGGATLTPVITIGDVNGADEYLFTSISEVMVARDGSVWVLDWVGMNKPLLRVYDAGGKYVRTVGGEGNGPGEFRGATGMAQLPDGRVVLRDISNNRINVYTAAGKVDTTWSFGATSYSWPIRGREGVRVDANGIVWMPFSYPRKTNEPFEQTPIGFLRMRPNGVIIDTVPAPVLPEVPAASITIVSANGRGRTRLGAPFQARANWFWHPGGYFGTVVSSRYAVDVRKPPSARDVKGLPLPVGPNVPATWKDGDPVVSIRRPSVVVELSPAELADQAAYLEAQVRYYDGTTTDPIPAIPKTKPPLRSVMVAPDGRIWVNVMGPSERFEPPAPEVRAGQKPRPVVKWRDRTTYDVFEADGTYLGQFVPPAGAGGVLSARGDELWWLARDEDGVNTLVKYKLTWK